MAAPSLPGDPTRRTPIFASLPAVAGGSSFGTEWWIAWGHLRSKQSTVVINVITLLAILGVTVGVGVLNCVIAVMAGFEIDLRDKILGANAHIVVTRPGGLIFDGEAVSDGLLEVPGVVAAAPFVYTELMIRSAMGHTGVIVKGLDPERTGEVTHLRDDLIVTPGGDLSADEQKRVLFDSIAGPIAPLNPDLQDGTDALPGIFIGKELRDQLAVSTGDRVQLINPLGDGTSPMGLPSPTVKLFRIAGVFDSGMYEYDTKWTYVSNADAQGFLKTGPGVNGIEVKVDAIHDVARITAAIDQKLGYPFFVRHWQDTHKKLFDALRLEKYVMGLILSMIVCVASLLIVSTLLMVVITKGREIAILKAMGASNASILRVFVMEGSFIGLVGTSCGTVLGLFGCWALWAYGWPLETDVYYLSTLPVVVEPLNVVGIAVGAFVICFLSTLIPAGLASTLDPVQGLRYE